MNLLTPIKSKESPRQIILEDYELDLPICGGWGYSKDDACIIDKFDSVVDQYIPFDGVKLEYIFVEKRIYEEMIIFRPDGERYAGIKWKLITQKLVDDGDRKFDKLIFEILAFSEKDWEELKTEYNGPHGAEHPEFNHDAHEKKRQRRMVKFSCEFWFDITSFFGQGLVITDPKTGERKLLPLESFTLDGSEPSDNGLNQYLSEGDLLNSKLLDPQSAIFNILGLLNLRLPKPWYWYCEDINESTSRGSTFRTWGNCEPSGIDVANITVVDVTDDPTEPDISVLDCVDLEKTNQYLKDETTAGLIAQGMVLVNWMPSQLKDTDIGKCLITAYVAIDDGKARQYVMHRLTVNGHKFVLMGCFDIAQQDIFENSIIDALQQVKIADS